MLHKRPELDTKNPPGQIKGDITLADYIERKTRELPKPVSFEEWFSLNKNWALSLATAKDLEEFAKVCWQAAQENRLG